MKLTAEETILVFCLLGALLLGASLRHCRQKPVPIHNSVREGRAPARPPHEDRDHSRGTELKNAPSEPGPRRIIAKILN
jgi:hypothetical protein